MGASATIFFLSPKYRKIMNKIFEKSSFKKIQWVDPSAIDAVILDSCFNHLEKSIYNMVQSRTNKIPEWIISMVVYMLEEEIRERTGIKISLINPGEFMNTLKNPVFSVLGNQDELIKQTEFFENYDKIPSKIK